MIIKILFQESKSTCHTELMEFDFAIVYPMVEGALWNAEVVGGLLGVEPFLLDLFFSHAYEFEIKGASMHSNPQIHKTFRILNYWISLVCLQI